MAHPARHLPELTETERAQADAAEAAIVAHTTPRPVAPNLPIIMNARDVNPGDLRFVSVPPAEPRSMKELKQLARGGAVLRGIKDLQQLQKQTIAVLEAVKGTLEDIAQVLRSPEATRGMEKQQNAATLLSKGFAREAVEQAQGAANLLPANPEAHLLLSLALAADQQFEQSLHAARKGLALFDRRSHPLAIEAGLLHALAALGCGAEAVERWAVIIDGLPLPVLYDHLARIAACFPAEASGGGDALLDGLVNRRLARDNESATQAISGVVRPRIGGGGKIQLNPDEIPATSLFAGLDATRDFRLANTHRAILGQISRRLQLVKEAGDVIRFLTECVVPMGTRELARTTEALGRAAVRRLFRLQGDAMTLHRALGKLQLAGAWVPMREVAVLLDHWRAEGNKVRRARGAMGLSVMLMAGGLAGLAYVLFVLGAIAGAVPRIGLLGGMPAVWLGPIVGGMGVLAGVYALMGRTWELEMPAGRAPLTGEELAYLNTAPVKREVKGALETGR